ncbi:MAG TPA: lactate racemase domain-containing protein [Gaiellaceae bacterium]|nr:lactate racemase domain-containing protein [Gaiellaceae bacterium]
MPRVPLLSGSRIVVTSLPDGALVLRPPPPGRGTDAEAATREALRFPLDGEPLESLARGARRATIVVQAPALPVPSPLADPRQRTIAAVSDALEALGIPTSSQTLLVACGLSRRASQREVAALVTPEFARRFHGRVAVHDAADPGLVPVDEDEEPALRVAPELVDTDLVVVVSAAESVLHGGPATLLAAANADAQRPALADSLLETGGSDGWLLATRLEHALAARVPLLGVSLVLNHPHGSGPLRGYPYEADAVERIAHSPLRRVFSAAPDPVRRRILGSLRLERTAAVVLAGPPSVAHAEALLRGIELRRTTLAEPLDALVLGVPWTTPFLPREQPNPLATAHLALGHALGLWRDAFPVVDGGIVILVDRFRRAFARPTQQPYLAFFRPTPIARSPELLAGAEAAAATDERAIDEYRAGRTVHPLLPFRDWDACRPALDRLGSVYVAGARDGTAARQLGFVPIGGLGAALDMAHGHRGPDARLGFLLAPPYFPLKVGG